MNLIYSRFKYLPNIIENVILVTRDYSTKRTVPITWVRPKKVSCILPEKSGDGGIDVNIKPTEFINRYDSLEELKNADEIVKRMFTVGFNRRKERVILHNRRILHLVQRHSQDGGSMEARIAAMTAEILQLQEHQEKFPKNCKSKVFLKELIEKRKKFLKKLRLQDYARFEFLLERLNLVFHPPPEENMYIKEKDSTKRLLKKKCDKIVKDKLDKYRAELESQHKTFFQEKAEKLQFIRDEEIACGVTPTVSEEEIECAKQRAASCV